MTSIQHPKECLETQILLDWNLIWFWILESIFALHQSKQSPDALPVQNCLKITIASNSDLS